MRRRNRSVSWKFLVLFGKLVKHSLTGCNDFQFGSFSYVFTLVNFLKQDQSLAFWFACHIMVQGHWKLSPHKQCIAKKKVKYPDGNLPMQFWFCWKRTSWPKWHSHLLNSFLNAPGRMMCYQHVLFLNKKIKNSEYWVNCSSLKRPLQVYLA